MGNQETTLVTGDLKQLTQDGSSIDELLATADDRGHSRLAQWFSRARRS